MQQSKASEPRLLCALSVIWKLLPELHANSHRFTPRNEPLTPILHDAIFYHGRFAKCCRAHILGQGDDQTASGGLYWSMLGLSSPNIERHRRIFVIAAFDHRRLSVFPGGAILVGAQLPDALLYKAATKRLCRTL